MEFVYREVQAVLTHKHNIAGANLTAFRGRIQHMQRLGFPSGVNTGKGNPVRYTWRELLLLGLAFEYVEIGATPDRSVAEISKFEDTLLAGICEMILAKPQLDDGGSAKCFLLADLSALLTLKVEERWHQQCSILTIEDINRMLSAQGDDAYRSPYTIVDLRQFLGGLTSSVIDVCGLDNRIVASDIKAWAFREASVGAELI
ncbi:hypothetical protein [Parasphingorhabdus sp.]|uniref:hypothetical protein n=1 Tax=Parasphingorhabdus sp. TaxID=2709688 RepID=UPI003D2BDA77